MGREERTWSASDVPSSRRAARAYGGLAGTSLGLGFVFKNPGQSLSSLTGRWKTVPPCHFLTFVF